MHKVEQCIAVFILTICSDQHDVMEDAADESRVSTFRKLTIFQSFESIWEFRAHFDIRLLLPAAHVPVVANVAQCVHPAKAPQALLFAVAAKQVLHPFVAGRINRCMSRKLLAPTAWLTPTLIGGIRRTSNSVTRTKEGAIRFERSPQKFGAVVLTAHTCMASTRTHVFREIAGAVTSNKSKENKPALPHEDSVHSHLFGTNEKTWR